MVGVKEKDDGEENYELILTNYHLYEIKQFKKIFPMLAKKEDGG